MTDNDITTLRHDPDGLMTYEYLANLSKYAKEMKLYSKVMNVMEVLLNG